MTIENVHWKAIWPTSINSTKFAALTLPNNGDTHTAKSTRYSVDWLACEFRDSLSPWDDVLLCLRSRKSTGRNTFRGRSQRDVTIDTASSVGSTMSLNTGSSQISMTGTILSHAAIAQSKLLLVLTFYYNTVMITVTMSQKRCIGTLYTCSLY